MDMELADRYLNSICQISIIEWDNFIPIKEINTYIYPDCDVEEFFLTRHGLTAEHLITAPKLGEKWIEIFNMLENKLVFCHNANQKIKILSNIASSNYLNLPDFSYACTQSIAKRSWPMELDGYKLNDIAKKLDVEYQANNSRNDAMLIANIVQTSISIHQSDSIQSFFESVGFATGRIYNQERIVYTSYKGRNNTYTRKPRKQKQER